VLHLVLESKEEKKYYLERVKGELREACENISLEKDDKATCDFTLADLRKYLFKRKDIDPSYIRTYALTS
jgi:hypothetical protein